MRKLITQSICVIASVAKQSLRVKSNRFPRRLRLLAMTAVLFSFGLQAGELQVDPNKTFSISVPGNMLPCSLLAGSLKCPHTNPVLTIQVIDTPEDSGSKPSVELMALNAEDSLQDKPEFKLLKKENILIDGYRSIVQTMTFNNLGNVDLPVLVRTLSSVVGKKAVSLEVACNQNTCKELVDSFDEAIKSLHLAKKGQKLKNSGSESGSGLGLESLLDLNWN